MNHYFGQRPGAQSAIDVKQRLIIALWFLLTLSATAAFFILRAPVTHPPIQRVVIEEEPHSTVSVLVPAYDIPKGTRLEPRMFNIVATNRTLVTAGVITDPESIAGAYSAFPLIAGQPLHKRYLSDRQSRGLDGQIPKGYVAVTIRIKEEDSNTGLLRPDDYVNVSLLARVDGKLSASIILQNIRVLMVDKDVDPNWHPGMPTPSTVTLLITNKEFEAIQVAQAMGTLNLALKGEDIDPDPLVHEPMTPDEVLHHTKPAAPAQLCQNTLIAEGKTYCVQPNGKLTLKIEQVTR